MRVSTCGTSGLPRFSPMATTPRRPRTYSPAFSNGEALTRSGIGRAFARGCRLRQRELGTADDDRCDRPAPSVRDHLPGGLHAGADGGRGEADRGEGRPRAAWASADLEARLPP